MTIYHTHHIIPRHMGGTDDPSNLVKLTVEEHAEAHRKLYEEHGQRGDYLAWKALSGQIGKEEILYERSRLGASQPGEKNAMWGKTHSDEAKRKMSETRKGVKLSEEHKAKISASHKKRDSFYWTGKTLSDEHKNNLSKATKGIPKSEETRAKMKQNALSRPKHPCPSCGKKMDAGNLTRHMKKCTTYS